MQRLASAHALVVLRQLLAEVQPFLEIGSARGELAADRKITAPCAPAARHVNAELLFRALLEERPTGRQQRLDDTRLDAVANDIEETKLARGPVDLRGDMVAPGPALVEERQIDDGQTRRISGGGHRNPSNVMGH